MMVLFAVNYVDAFMLMIVYASILVMFTIGLNMIYAVLKFSNFAHAEFITMGMYMGWWFLQILNLFIPYDMEINVGFGITFYGSYLNNIIVQASLAFISVGIAAMVIDKIVFRKMRSLKANATTFTVGSIGVGLILRYGLAMIWKEIPQASVPAEDNIAHLPGILDTFEGINIILFENDPFFGTQSFSLSQYQIMIIIISVILVIIFDYMFKATKFGIALRATSDSMELAQVTGINTKRIVYYTWLIAAGVTGFASTFVRARFGDFSNLDGQFYLLPVFAVAILGGVGSFKGGIIASYILAFARQVAFIVLQELQRPGGFGLEKGFEATLDLITFKSSYADGIAFLILIIVLLVRPQGIYGSVDSTRARV